jgi:hypothetical protein
MIEGVAGRANVRLADAVDARRAVGRRSFSSPIPVHVGVLLGLATAGYAVSLAGVSAFQASAEAELAAARAPLGAAVDRTAADHDRLTAALDEATRAYEAAAGRSGSLADQLQAVEARIADLAAIAHDLDGATRALPTKLALPPIVRSVSSGQRTTVHATSGGSAAP